MQKEIDLSPLLPFWEQIHTSYINKKHSLSSFGELLLSSTNIKIIRDLRYINDIIALLFDASWSNLEITGANKINTFYTIDPEHPNTDFIFIKKEESSVTTHIDNIRMSPYAHHEALKWGANSYMGIELSLDENTSIRWAIWSKKIENNWKEHNSILQTVLMAIKLAYKESQHQKESQYLNKAIQNYKLGRSAFMRRLGHDINTPMVGIAGALHLLESKSIESKDIECLQTAKISLQRLEFAIHNWFNLPCVSQNNILLQNAPFKLGQLYKDIELLANLACQNKNIGFSLDATHQDVYIDADEHRLRQLILHLLDNAVKFTEKGSVQIKLRLLGLHSNKCTLHVKVIDTGIGMSKTRLDRIQDKMQNFVETNDQVGLFICQQTINTMGGTIHINSKENEGTTAEFMVNLNVASLDHIPNSNINILVVEDDPINRRIFKKILENIGYKADFATNGHEAVQKVQQNDYDLIFMDVEMPYMDGITATKSILEMESNQQPKIVVVTANNIKDAYQKCMQAGASAYLNKPVRPTLIKKTIDECIQNRIAS